MRFSKLAAAVSLVASVAALPTAHAALITFEGQSNAIYTAAINRAGFLIGNVAGDEQHFHEITSTNYGLPNNGTGILLNDRESRIYVEEQSGADFSLLGVDVAAALGNAPALGLTIEGFLNGSSVGVFNIASLGTGYTAVGALFGAVDRVVFDGFGNGGGFVLDNLNVGDAVNGVPVPATLGLALGALFAAGASRRKTR